MTRDLGGHAITMLGTGLIGDFYTNTLQRQRGRDHVRVVYSRSADRAAAFKDRWGIAESTTDLKAAVEHPDTDVVVIGLPNFLHEEAVELVARAGKAVLLTKPLGRTAAEARRMLAVVEEADVFAGYLEDLCYTPKTLKAIASVRGGAVGDVTWVRSRETHPGPHSAWFWDGRLTGGGAIIDLGCHCIEIIRNFVGKGNRPVDVLCHTDTLVHPIADEDNAIALIRFESGAVGQFEVSWTFRGGMDLRDEVSELGYADMFNDMFAAIDGGTEPQETFYDGYVVNSIMDACYASAKAGTWAPIELEWRGGTTPRIATTPERYEGQVVIKREILPDGRHKLILKDEKSGDFSDRIVAAG